MGRLGALTAAEARQRSAAWAVRAAEDLYDARYAAEVADLEGTGAAAVRAASDVGNTATMPFATFARRRAQELLGVRALWERHVWELAMNMETLSGAEGISAVHADASAVFFTLCDPRTPAEAVTFFLWARQHLLRTLSRSVSPPRRIGAASANAPQGTGAALLLTRPSLRAEVAEGIVAAAMGSAPRLMRAVMRLVTVRKRALQAR